MRRLFLAIALFLCLGLVTRAQVFIINDSVFQDRMSEITVTVLDSLTNEPVPFASVYVIPAKDTTITNFTLSDAKGEAKLDEVPFGNYVFHIEMMGYKPIVKERFFRERQVNMGTIRLQQDELFLQAATVTDVGNPIVFKQDTVEFNASSFRVGANAMLKDLLQRMPGMEITEDGKVKFNGEEIDQLTVGGRTFFFDDQSTALNNLPAAVVEKIRVIDRESETTRATGIQDGQREKVLDVALKKEYEKGWFGNVGIKGGADIGSNPDDPMQADKGLLYNVNALLSAYGEKDQLTLIANGQNVTDSNGVFVVVSGDGDVLSSSDQGLTTAYQLGVNTNTSRIKDVETTAGANYKYTDTDSGTLSSRTTYLDGEDLLTTTENRGKQYAHSVTGNLELEKEQGKVWFHFRPDFRYSKTDTYNTNSSETFRSRSLLNKSEGSTRSLSDQKTADMNGDISFRELGGKKGRTLSLHLDGYYSGSTGESDVLSRMQANGQEDKQDLHYVSSGQSYQAYSMLQYAEPIGDKWTLATSAMWELSRSRNVRNASDVTGYNEYYSSERKSNVGEQSYRLTAQYKFNDGTWLTLGASVDGVLNEVYSRSYNVSETTGKGEWNWFLAPYLRFQYSKDKDRITVQAQGSNQQPSSSQMSTVLSLGNPSRLSVGNIYLKPYGFTTTYLNWNRSNRERFSSLMTYLSATIRTNAIGSAQWYDTDGILYSVPVNIRKPSANLSFSSSYTTPLDAKKNWSLILGASASYSSSFSYQARSTLSGWDNDHFDYAAFMRDFWGDESGGRFYSGQSGFAESRTRSLNPSASFQFRFNQDRYSFALGASTQGRIARYSLDPTANLNTMDTRFTARGSYISKHEFEFNSDIAYVLYRGYAEGYGQPEWQWNAEISKNIGAFNLSIKCQDILNQTRNLTHTVTANYEEDTYRLILGRYILFGVKWNFGKMNAAHSQRAQSAALNMVF